VTRNVVRGVFVAVTVLAVLTLRVVVAGELEIAESSRALVAGDPREAVVHARSAALWYAPGAPHVRVAYERLLALGAAAEAHHDADTSLLAYRGVTTASESTKWVVVPHRADALQAREKIARIEATLPRPPDQRLEPTPSIERAELEELSREHGPQVVWVIALATSFVLWAAGLLWVVVRGFDGSGRLSLPRSALGVIAGVLGFVGWLVGLYWA
jgi:hypothetical protein